MQLSHHKQPSLIPHRASAIAVRKFINTQNKISALCATPKLPLAHVVYIIYCLF